MMPNQPEVCCENCKYFMQHLFHTYGFCEKPGADHETEMDPADKCAAFEPNEE